MKISVFDYSRETFYYERVLFMINPGTPHVWVPVWAKKNWQSYPTRATGGLLNLRGQNLRFCAVTGSLYKNGVFLGLLAWNKIGWTFFHPSNPKKVSVFESKCRKLHFLKLSKKSYFGAVFLTKTTVLTSILTSEVTYMVPQPQFELGKVPETQSGTWGNLVPHMCKSQQTTSVKD